MLVIDALIETGRFADAGAIAASLKQAQEARPAVAATEMLR